MHEPPPVSTGPTPPVPPWGQRLLQGSVYVDDDGTADAALRSALQGDADGTVPYPAVVAALAAARLLVPVVALLGETGEGATGADGTALVTDKSSDMAAVLLTGADGRLALLAFTDVAALAAWDPAARPVPVAAHLAAATAVQEGADALVLDVAGPHRFVVSGDDLRRLAAGWRPVQLGEQAGGGWAWLGTVDEEGDVADEGEQGTDW